jgi:hypothetical protein
VVIHRDHPEVEALFRAWREPLGADWAPYRHHVYRVLNVAAELSHAEGDDLDRLALAAAFHDVGIWLDSTFDYLEPSARRAARHLGAAGKGAWIPEVEAMIREHHKVRRASGAFVEAFRRADWLDVSLFLLPGGPPSRDRSLLLETFPRAGFHQRLVAIGAAWLRRHPLRPLPMLRW